MNNYIRILEHLNQFIDSGKFQIIEILGKEFKLGEEEFKRLLHDLQSSGYIELIENTLDLDFTNNPEFGKIIEVKLQARITFRGSVFLTDSMKK